MRKSQIGLKSIGVGANKVVKASVVAGLLAIGVRFDIASVLLSLVACMLLVFYPLERLPTAAICLMLVAGVVQQIIAMRTAFDQYIFASWAQQWRIESVNADAEMVSFDQALADIGLLRNVNRTRSLDERITGAVRLLRHQALCVAMQVAAWFYLMVCIR